MNKNFFTKCFLKLFIVHENYILVDLFNDTTFTLSNYINNNNNNDNKITALTPFTTLTLQSFVIF